MKIALCQLNYTIGAFEENLSKIQSAINTAQDADYIVFTELCLSGYYPWDMLEREAFFEGQDKVVQALKSLSSTIKGRIVVGLAEKNPGGGKPYLNALNVFYRGEKVFNYYKKLLPTYNIFDEKRHFEEGVLSGIYYDDIHGKNIGFLICEDGWNDEEHDYITNPVKDLVRDNADILISINASPSNLYKQAQRDALFGSIAKKYQRPLVYVNQVGGQDEVVFDGGSFVFNDRGEKIVQMGFFREEVYIWDMESADKYLAKTFGSKEEFYFEQIACGLKDYIEKQNTPTYQKIKGVVIGSSGGIDSAITLAIAALTLGKDRVHAITMPSKFSSAGSVDDSVYLCKNLGVELMNIPIKQTYDVLTEDMASGFGFPLVSLTKENLQSRIRGQILMAYSNNTGNMVLATGNKSELSVGYCTLYGDTNGGLNLIGDLYKMEVYALSRWINEKFGQVIPQSIIDKEPSAELAEGQRDTDSLPPYPVLDSILKIYLEGQYLSQEEAAEANQIISRASLQTIKRVLTLLDAAEFKRKQSPLIIRIHSKAFGNGRKIPIVQKLAW